MVDQAYVFEYCWMQQLSFYKLLFDNQTIKNNNTEMNNNF